MKVLVLVMRRLPSRFPPTSEAHEAANDGLRELPHEARPVECLVIEAYGKEEVEFFDQ